MSRENSLSHKSSGSPSSKSHDSTSQDSNTKSSTQYFAIIPAAGIGSRMTSVESSQAKKTNSVPKQYIGLGDKSILEITLIKLLSLPWIDTVCVALHAQDIYWHHIYEQLSEAYKRRITFTTGGATRADSVLAGMKVINAKHSDWVLVHDAARPCVLASDIEQLKLTVTANYDSSARPICVGGILAAPVTDTIKQLKVYGPLAIDDAEGKAITETRAEKKSGMRAETRHQTPKTIDRNSLYKAQTPQMFIFSALQDAITACLQKNLEITDEASAIEHQENVSYLLVEASQQNIKLTYPDDLLMVEAILRNQSIVD